MQRQRTIETNGRGSTQGTFFCSVCVIKDLRQTTMLSIETEQEVSSMLCICVMDFGRARLQEDWTCRVCVK
jgi:hypothetical protein